MKDLLIVHAAVCKSKISAFPQKPSATIHRNGQNLMLSLLVDVISEQPLRWKLTVCGYMRFHNVQNIRY